MTLMISQAPLILAKYVKYMDLRGYSQRTQRQYKGYMDLFLDYLRDEGVSDLKDVDKCTIRRYQDYLYSYAGIGLRAQESRLCAIKNFFAYLEKEGEILYNPAMHIELPKLRDHLPRSILNEREVKRLLTAPDIDTDLGLRDRAIFDGKQINIRMGKGAKDRNVPIGDIALIYVREYIEHARPKLVKKNEITNVFVSRTGRKLTDDIVPWIVQKHAKRAGIKMRIGSHTIRHSFATHILKHGAPIRYIQEMLGHKTLDTTQRYTRVEITDLKKIHKKTHPRDNGK